MGVVIHPDYGGLNPGLNNGHNPESDVVVFFSTGSPLRDFMDHEKKLKFMHSPRIVEAASERAQKLFSEKVTD